jgi:phospholipid/cholesterol/gamma-HCH transport system permease protein
VFNALDFGDLIPATIKVSFGFAIGLVGCFKGYYCKKGTGVGVAANSAVVYTSMLLFIIDFIAVLLLIYFMISNYECD